MSIRDWLRGDRAPMPQASSVMPSLELLEPRVLLSADLLGTEPSLLERPLQEQAVVVDLVQGVDEGEDGNSPLLTIALATEEQTPAPSISSENHADDDPESGVVERRTDTALPWAETVLETTDLQVAQQAESVLHEAVRQRPSPGTENESAGAVVTDQQDDPKDSETPGIDVRGPPQDTCASDRSGTSTENTAADRGWTNILTEGFEGAFPGTNWTVLGTPTWDDTSYTAHSGSWSGYCVDSAVNPPGPYPSNTNAWMIYGPFSLADATDAKVDFWYRNQSEAGYDPFFWGVSVDSASYSGYEISGNQNSWRAQSFDLKSVPQLGNLCGRSQVWLAFVFESDSTIADIGAFVDDIVISKSVNNQPNLAPCLLPGWSDKIVVSKQTGTHTDDAPLSITDTLYVDWAATNGGGAGVGQTFYSRLYVDEALKQTWSTPADQADPGASFGVSDYNIGSLSAGTHTVRIALDYDNRIAEGSETDNGYTKSLPVGGGASAAWTFMVYADGDNDLEGAALDDFLEMASVGSNANVNIVAQIDRVGGYDSRYGNWTDTRRGRILAGNVPDTTWGTSIGEANMGDPATLTNFVQWAVGAYPASHYALVLWDHGSGWRVEEVVKGACWDDTSGGDYLENREVGGALAAIPQNLDLFGYDCCLMGMIECAHEVQNEASVYVGSEKTIPWTGWPYQTILADLVAHPTWTAAALGSDIVTRYGQSYGGAETLSAIDLSKIGTLSTAISQLATAIVSNANPAAYSALQTHRTSAASFSDSAFRDLGTFLTRVASDATVPGAIRTAAATALTAWTNVVLANHSGASDRGTGLSIYFQGPGSLPDSDYNASIIDFAADTQWDEFPNWWKDGPQSAQGEIGGSKWNDLDGDGIWDAGEPRLPGWTIYLDFNHNGTLDPGEPSDVTDANGNYVITGLAPGTYTVAEVPQAGWQQTCPLPGGEYDIDLVLNGFTSSQAAIFTQAADRWEQIITGDVPAAQYQGGIIDDIQIEASSIAIDGPGGILGWSWVDAERSGSFLPVHGSIQYDTADLPAMESGGYLLPVAEHEIAHTLGFGIIWANLNLLVGTAGTDPRFIGPQATAEYDSIFHTGEISVPIEATGGSGTRLSHWRESVFDNELMTGWINTGRANPLSRITVGSIQDLGYVVNMSAADSYTAPLGGLAPDMDGRLPVLEYEATIVPVVEGAAQDRQGSGTYTVVLGPGEIRNNINFGNHLTVTLPDLSWYTLSSSPTTVAVGGMLTINRNYQVSTTAVTPDFAIQYHLSPNTTWGDADDVLLTPDETINTTAGKTVGLHAGTFSVTVPASTTARSYYLLAKVDNGGAVGESNEANNVKLGSLLTVTGPQLPDLAWYTLSGSPTSVAVGGTLTINRNYQVSTTAVTPDFAIQYRLSPNTTWGDADDVLVTPDETVNTAAGKTVGLHAGTFSVTVPTSTAARSYYLLAKVDNGSTVGESNEINNVKLGSLLTVTGPQLPDLAWYTLSGSPTSVVVGGTLTISRNYQISTTAVTPDFAIQYRLSPNTTWGDADDVLLTPDETINTPAGKTVGLHAGTFSVTVPASTAARSYYLLAKVDNGSTVGESNETNNVKLGSLLTVTGPQMPDLAWYTLSGSPTSVAVGGTLTINRSYQVSTTAVTPDFAIQYHLSPNTTWGDADDVLLTPDETVNTAGGKTVGLHAGTFSLTVPTSTAARSYYLLAKVDNGGAVGESNETNNVKLGSLLTVTGPQVPDLAWYTLCGSPTSVAVGGTLTINRNYQVSTTAVTPDFAIQYRLSPNTTWGDADDVLLTPDETINAAAGKTVGLHAGTFSVTVPASTAARSYYLLAKVDNGNTVGESNETNNIKLGGLLTVTGPQVPDLSWYSLSGSPTSVAVGGTLTINRNYQVSTTAVTPDFAIQYHLSPNTTWGDADDVLLTPDETVNTAAGKTVGLHAGTFSLTVPTSTAARSYYLLAKVDNGGAVGESNETNNVKIGSLLTVTAPIAAAWTFMVYMDGDNNLEPFAIGDFLEMASAGSTSNVNVVAQLDRSAGYDVSNGNWTDTRRGRVLAANVPNTGWGASIGEANMGDPATLVSFVQWAINTYPATRYGLVLWDHGGGWEGACWDDSVAGDCLELREIGNALAAVPQNMDLFGYDCCLMGMIECAYEVRGEASVYIGSEKVEPGDGWPYDTIVRDLVAHPTWDARALATDIVTRYGQSYGGNQTLSAVDLSKVGALSSAVSPLADMMLEFCQTPNAGFLYAPLMSAPSFGEYHDLGAILGNVANDTNLPTAMRATAQAARAAYTAAVIANHSGPSDGGTGLSIYLPVPLLSLPRATDNPLDAYAFTLRFATDTMWDEFLTTWTGYSIL